MGRNNQIGDVMNILPGMQIILSLKGQDEEGGELDGIRFRLLGGNEVWGYECLVLEGMWKHHVLPFETLESFKPDLEDQVTHLALMVSHHRLRSVARVG